MKSTVKKVVITSVLAFVPTVVASSTIYVPNGHAQTSSPTVTANADHVQSSNKFLEKVFLENLNELLAMDTQKICNEKEWNALKREWDEFIQKNKLARDASKEEAKEHFKSLAKIRAKYEIYNQEELSKYADRWIQKLTPFKGKLDGVADELIKLFEGFRDGTYDKEETFSIHEQVINNRSLRKEFELGDDLKFYMKKDNKVVK